MFKVLRKAEAIKVGDQVAIDSTVYAGEKRLVEASYSDGRRQILKVLGSPELFELLPEDLLTVWVR